jgi:hypothetical protein
MGRKPLDLTGKQFGNLTAIEIADHGRDDAGRVRIYWKCKCKCGNETVVRVSHLRDGTTISCGCTGRGRGIGFKIHEHLRQSLGTKKYKEFCGQLPKHLRIKAVETG